MLGKTSLPIEALRRCTLVDDGTVIDTSLGGDSLRSGARSDVGDCEFARNR